MITCPFAEELIDATFNERVFNWSLTSAPQAKIKEYSAHNAVRASVIVEHSLADIYSKVVSGKIEKAIAIHDMDENTSIFHRVVHMPVPCMRQRDILFRRFSQQFKDLFAVQANKTFEEDTELAPEDGIYIRSGLVIAGYVLEAIDASSTRVYWTGIIDPSLYVPEFVVKLVRKKLVKEKLIDLVAILDPLVDGSNQHGPITGIEMAPIRGDSLSISLTNTEGGDWERVVDEASGKIYLWNTVTGETQWAQEDGISNRITPVTINPMGTAGVHEQ